MRKIIAVLLLTTFWAVPETVCATETYAREWRPYVSVGGGYGFSRMRQKVEKVDETTLEVVGTGSENLPSKGYPVADVAVGVHFDSNYRMEIKYNYRGAYKASEQTDDFYFENLAGDKDYPRIQLNMKTQTLMLQGYYNFANAPFAGVNSASYVGAGFGVARMKYEYNLYSTSIVPGQRVLHETRKRTKPAFTILAGVSYDLTDLISVDAGLRYLYAFFKTDNTNAYNSIDGTIDFRFNF